jgi:hypothetical protein
MSLHTKTAFLEEADKVSTVYRSRENQVWLRNLLLKDNYSVSNYIINTLERQK